MFASGWSRLALAGAATVLGMSAMVNANGIVNSSFEDDVVGLDTWVYQANGWVVTGDAGTFHPISAAYPGGAPLGNNVGFVQSGWAMPTGILEQTTGISVEAGKTYAVEAMIGRRVDNPLIPWGGYVMSLYADDRLLTQDITLVHPGAGMFAPASLTYVERTGLDGPVQFLRIKFEALYGQTNIDDVRVTVSPTPGTVALGIAAVMMVSITRRR